MSRAADMPDWPALMDAPTAAAYCCVSESTVRAVLLRRGIKPVDMGCKSVRYRRADLDRMIDSLPTVEAGSPIPVEPVRDLAEEALRLVKARA